MQQPTPNPSTTRFQLALPSLLSAISPSLSALHATRVRLLYPQDDVLSGTHCTICGFPLIANGSRTRSVRTKRRSVKALVNCLIRRSCLTCGHDNDIPLGVADAPAFPKPRERVKRKLNAVAINRPRALGAAVASPPAHLSSSILVPAPHPSQSIPSPATPLPSRSGSASPHPTVHASGRSSSTTSSKAPSSMQDLTRSSRPKHKSGLQNMLARNRERQEQEKKRDGRAAQGLSAFLQGL